jgi:hypothetical protein
MLLTPIPEFFKAFGAAAGQDSYAAVKQWVKDLLAARASSPAERGYLEIDDPEGTHLIVSTETSDEALEALAGIDWEEHRGDFLIWDDESGTWRDAPRRR